MEVLPALNRFIEAFEALDLDAMMNCFSEDATIFFPVRHYSSKVTGKNQITSRFDGVIQRINAAGLTRISLPVEDLDIVDYGEIAVATFHIRDNDLSRRTIVLRKTGSDWQITNFHASNAPLEETE